MHSLRAASSAARVLTEYVVRQRNLKSNRLLPVRQYRHAGKVGRSYEVERLPAGGDSVIVPGGVQDCLAALLRARGAKPSVVDADHQGLARARSNARGKVMCFFQGKAAADNQPPQHWIAVAWNQANGREQAG